MKLLKIAIFAQLDSQTITEQLAPTLRDRGHTVDIIDLSTVSKTDFIAQPEVQALTDYDLVYYRSGLETNGSADRIVELEGFLKHQTVKTVNLHYTTHPFAHSKTYETQQAEKDGLTIPKSVYLDVRDYSKLSSELGTPFITKTDLGTNGLGVHLIHDEVSFTEVIDLYPTTKLLFQEFIEHDFEYRVHVMDGVAMCIYKKAPPEDDFRSNEAQGGEMLQADPKYVEELNRLAQITFNTFGFEIFVADFMLDKNTDTFYFTEINLNPGWELNDRVVTGIDVIGLTADFFEKVCSK